MNSVVVYATRKGNTKLVAQKIADVLGERGSVELCDVDRAPADMSRFDLVVIGGPTEGHGVTPAMNAYLDRLDEATLRARPSAAFDTRLAWPRVLSGSAAEGIAQRLRGAGALMAAGPESFIVSTKQELASGELEHAAHWARQIAQAVSPATTRR
jgi:menaquinone-dependent protoporphyrinogen IX oxidase